MRNILLFFSLVLFSDSYAQLRSSIGSSNGKRFRTFVGMGSFTPHQFSFYSQNYETEDYLLTYGMDYSIYTPKVMTTIFISSGTEMSVIDSSPSYPDYRFQFFQFGVMSGFRVGVDRWSFAGQLGANYIYGNFTLIALNLRQGLTFFNSEEKAHDVNVMLSMSANRFLSYNHSIGLDLPVSINRRGAIITPVISFSYHWL